MKNAISIFNDVLGPIMRGPSSSHTAGPFHIGKLGRELFGAEPSEAIFVFDPAGSFAQVYRQQGSDLGFAAGVMGWELTDEQFSQSLERAARLGCSIQFRIENLDFATHPNTVVMLLSSRSGRQLEVIAQSIGGGAIVISKLDNWPIHISGDSYEVIVETTSESVVLLRQRLQADGNAREVPQIQKRDGRALLHFKRNRPLPSGMIEQLRAQESVRQLWTAPPIFFTQSGAPLFTSAEEMVALADDRNCSLGEIGLAYEAALLDLAEAELISEMGRRFAVMQAAVQRGLDGELPGMQLLHPSAGKIFQAEAEGRVAIGGIHTRAAARALAVMHVNGGMGVVCAAPTAGSAGVIPGVIVTLAQELNLSPIQIAKALFAASAIGMVIAHRATFAAEVAGCQVEIGASGAMAAAAVVEVSGGGASRATDAAAIALQNTMGTICDPVQGIVEIPCHTRNGVAASSAFVCADLVLGGYQNPIPLDETIDAMFAVGKLMPRQLKCTALGGLAQTPSALLMPRLRP